MSGSDPLRVLCLTTLPRLGGGNRLRIEQYREPLRAYGIELTMSPFFDDSTYAVLYERGHLARKVLGVLRGLGRRLRDALRAPGHDLTLVYRESAPLGPPLFERLLSLLGRPYILDFDDAIFLAPVHPVNRRWAWLRHPSRVAASARGAREVTVGNEYLAAWARARNERVTIIPTSVDLGRHRPRRHAPSSGPLVLGWVGSSTTAPYLHLLDAALDLLAERREVVLRVIGGRYEHARVRVECLPYSIETEPDDVAAFDIGLLPEPDDDWTKGKGAFKALLYMAAEVPVVASRVGVNEEVIGTGVAGYCVDGAREWVEAILRLADDPALRERLGRSGRDRVARLYSVDVQAPILAAVLRRAAA